MKLRKLFALPMLVFALLALYAVAFAEDKAEIGPYKVLTTIAVPSGFAFCPSSVTGCPTPGPVGGFDISWVDSHSGRYYVADRGNSTAKPPVPPGIDVIDTEHNKFLYYIPLSTAANGVAAIRGSDDDEGESGMLLAGVSPHTGASDSGLVIVDLAHPLASPLFVNTNGNHRADELAYDPEDHIVLIANDQDTPSPFISLISIKKPAHVLATIVYDGSAGNPKTTGGIEQPVWDGVKHRFYLAIPSTAANPKGEVDEIDPKAMTVKTKFVTTCGPAGLVLIPGQRLMTSCGDVLDIGSGKVVLPPVAGVSADEIWYNSGDGRVYFGGFNGSAVVNGLAPYNVIGALPWTGTFKIPFPPNVQFSHSIAADSENNRIFVPITNVGVMVFTDATGDGEESDN